MPEDFLDNLAEVGVRVLIAAAVLVVRAPQRTRTSLPVANASFVSTRTK